jgi:decaprenylphospho-beta-D-ribofuranose 2-oxidase
MLPNDHLEWVEGWGMAVGAAGYVFRPSTVEGISSAFESARSHGVRVVLRGAGRSYGDAATGSEDVVPDLSRMNRVISWNPTTGVIEVEPGVSIRRLWRYSLSDGWWPPVVTGTMEPTVGGCLAMNVHGKNNWTRGTFGEHCLELDLMTASGELRTLRPDFDSEIFRAVIGGFGQLGVVVRARLQLKRVHSGLLEVQAVSAPDLDRMLELADEANDRWEYVVGWIDAFSSGRKLGRGLLHFARHLDSWEDPAPAQSLLASNQDLPDTMMGIVPKSLMWRLLKPFTNRPGMRLVNRAKYLAGSTIGDGELYHQTLAEFNFLLDYVPGWKRIYLPGGTLPHAVIPGGVEEASAGRVSARPRRGRFFARPRLSGHRETSR